MRLNANRIGRFTSSQIYRLMGTDAVKKTYIREILSERRIGKSIDSGATTRPMSWGKFMEIVLFQLLDDDYRMDSKETQLHPKYPDIWAGSRDLHVPRVKVGEIKSYQYKKFSPFVDCIMQKDLKLFKSLFPQEYWQIVSNCIISKVRVGEIIAYMPYESEIPEIQKMANDYDGDGWEQYKWIVDAKLEDLTSLPDDGYYSNVTTFTFDIPADDIIQLTKAVIASGKELDEAMAA